MDRGPYRRGSAGSGRLSGELVRDYPDAENFLYPPSTRRWQAPAATRVLLTPRPESLILNAAHARDDARISHVRARGLADLRRGPVDFTVHPIDYELSSLWVEGDQNPQVFSSRSGGSLVEVRVKSDLTVPC